MAATSTSTSTSAVCLSWSAADHQSHSHYKPYITRLAPKPHRLIVTKLHVSSSSKPNIATATAAAGKKLNEESIFFDGGAHYGDLVANLVLGLTLLWLPLTLAAVFRAFSLRYRFTNLRVSVISGQERSDFSYDVVREVQVVPRFIGEWGDVIITLKDGTKVDLRSVPKFREIASYCLSMAQIDKEETKSKL